MESSYLIGTIIALILLLFCSAFFSAAETAYSSVSIVKIEAKAKSGIKSAKLIKKHYKSFGWTLATILVSNNLVNVALSSFATLLTTKILGVGAKNTIITTAIVTPILVIIGEITPKILAKKYPYGYLSKVVYVINFLNYLFMPLTYLMSKIALQSKITNTESDIKNLLSLARQEGVIEDGEATLAQRSLDLDSTIVHKIMTKKDKIIFVAYNSQISDVKKLFKKTGHSRILVKKGSSYVGVILLKDIFTLENDIFIKDYMHDIVKVSKSMLATNALEQMRMHNTQIAIVQTSLGSKTTVGLLTMEDIIEELIGEVYDEHDEIAKIKEIAHHKYIVYGSAKMKNLENELKMKFVNSDSLSVKQWIQSRINRVIKTNLRYEYKDKVIFKIIKNKNKQETIIEVINKI